MLLVFIVLLILGIGLAVAILVLATRTKNVCSKARKSRAGSSSLSLTIPLKSLGSTLAFALTLTLKNGMVVGGSTNYIGLDTGSDRPLQTVSATWCKAEGVPSTVTCFDPNQCESVGKPIKGCNSSGTYCQTFLPCTLGDKLETMKWSGVTWGKTPETLWLVDDNSPSALPAWVGFGHSSVFLKDMEISSFSIVGPPSTKQLVIPARLPFSPLVATPWAVFDRHGGRSVQITGVDGKALPKPLQVTLDTGNPHFCQLPADQTQGWPANHALPKSITFQVIGAPFEAGKNTLPIPMNAGGSQVGVYSHGALGLAFLRSYNWHVDDKRQMVYFSKAQ